MEFEAEEELQIQKMKLLSNSQFQAPPAEPIMPLAVPASGTNQQGILPSQPTSTDMETCPLPPVREPVGRAIISLMDLVPSPFASILQDSLLLYRHRTFAHFCTDLVHFYRGGGVGMNSQLCISFTSRLLNPAELKSPLTGLDAPFYNFFEVWLWKWLDREAD